MNTVLYPGSFDPITKGHESVALRAAEMFETVIVAIGQNADKKYRYSVEKRLELLRNTFAAVKNIEVSAFDGLTVNFCRQNNIRYIVRGIRSDMDWNMEASIAQANKLLYSDIETVFLLTEPTFAGISSSVVREVLSYGGDVSALVPNQIANLL